MSEEGCCSEARKKVLQCCPGCSQLLEGPEGLHLVQPCCVMSSTNPNKYPLLLPCHRIQELVSAELLEYSCMGGNDIRDSRTHIPTHTLYCSSSRYGPGVPVQKGSMYFLVQRETLLTRPCYAPPRRDHWEIICSSLRHPLTQATWGQ